MKATVNWCLEYMVLEKNGDRGQGLLALWRGGLVQWNSRRQPFATLFSSESELLGYVDGTVMGEGIVTVVLALTGDETKADAIRHLLGDNLGGLQLLIAPLKAVGEHDIFDYTTHTPGVELSADMLTKYITLKSSWATFKNKVNLVDVGGPEAVERKRTIAKVAIAAIGLAVLSRVQTS